MSRAASRTKLRARVGLPGTVELSQTSAPKYLPASSCIVVYGIYLNALRMRPEGAISASAGEKRRGIYAVVTKSRCKSISVSAAGYFLNISGGRLCLSVTSGTSDADSMANIVPLQTSHSHGVLSS